MKHSADANPPDRAFSVRDEGRLVDELQSLKNQRSPRQARAAKAIQILEQTNSSRVRNAAALALTDLRAHNAKDALLNVLTRPDKKGSRGTLLYALEQLGADVPLPVLANVIAEESYEAREEALDLIGRHRVECSSEDFARARTTLEAARASADSERSQAIHRALEYLRIKHH
jgi:HEAT repeat protein